MPLTLGSSKAKAAPSAKTQRPQGSTPTPTDYVIGEINAFIAIRDELLVEAEEAKTRSKLDSVILANDFVETCLTPSGPPYENQNLPEADATRERQRCQDIKKKVANLLDQIEVR